VVNLECPVHISPFATDSGSAIQDELVNSENR
jgi:hypothetical protein